MLRLVLSLLLPAAPAFARYDPDADRFALRRAATACTTTVVDATGLALLPEKVPAIMAGLGEGARQASLASSAARSLDDGAQRRAKEMEAGAGAAERKAKDLAEPVAAERLRADKLSAELDGLERRIDALPVEERDKLKPLAARAAAALGSAGDALRPAEEAAKALAGLALDMKAVRREGLRPLGELAAGAAATIERAGESPRATAEAEATLASLGDAPARARAWEKLEVVRGVSRLLFEAADRACNRADDFRRVSAAYDDAANAFERARPSASPADARARFDEAQKMLAQIRERLKKPA